MNTLQTNLFMTCLFASVVLFGQNATNWAREWKLDGSLEEVHGLCPLHGTREPVFVTEDGRKFLKISRFDFFTANDDPLYRLEPGLRFACRVKFDEIGRAHV